MYDELHQALMDLVSFFNRPQEDNTLLQRANVSLDTALFPLLMRISMQGSLGITALADEANRDYTTISRQVRKLEERGLVTGQPLAEDHRVRQVSVTAAGQEIIAQISAARNHIMDEVLADWDEQSKADLTRLVQKLASTLQAYSKKE